MATDELAEDAELREGEEEGVLMFFTQEEWNLWWEEIGAGERRGGEAV